MTNQEKELLRHIRNLIEEYGLEHLLDLIDLKPEYLIYHCVEEFAIELPEVPSEYNPSDDESQLD